MALLHTPSGAPSGARNATRPRSSFVPDLVLLGIAAIWGGSYLATQELAASIGAAAVLCARFLPPAVIMLVGVAVARRGRSPGPLRHSLPPGAHQKPGSLRPSRSLRSVLRAGSLLGLLRAATIVLETIGVTLTTATNAGLIIGLSILLTPLLESLVTRRRLTRSLLGSVVLALVGIALLIGGSGLAEVTIGDGLILLAAITRALLGVAEARATRSHASDVLGLTTVEITLGAILFTAWGGGALLHRLPELTAADWGVILYLGLGCTVAAFLGQLWATKRTSASRAGMLLGSEPGWALLIGIVIGGEQLTIGAGIGAAVLLAAMLWGRRAEERWRTSRAGTTNSAEVAPCGSNCGPRPESGKDQRRESSSDPTVSPSGSQTMQSTSRSPSFHEPSDGYIGQ